MTKVEKLRMGTISGPPRDRLLLCNPVFHQHSPQSLARTHAHTRLLSTAVIRVQIQYCSLAARCYFPHLCKTFPS